MSNYTNYSPERDWLTTLLLCFFVGFLGVHRFYTGSIGIGVAQFLTFGGGGIWWFVDLIMIFTGAYRDGEGRPLIKGSSHGHENLTTIERSNTSDTVHNMSNPTNDEKSSGSDTVHTRSSPVNDHRSNRDDTVRSVSNLVNDQRNNRRQLAMNNFVKTTMKIFGGAAIAGMGLSFGRDMYRKISKAGSKEVIQVIVTVTALVGIVCAPFVSGLWLTRNYRSRAQAVSARIGGSIIIVFFAVITGGLIDTAGGVGPGGVIAIIAVLILFLVGLRTGISQRKMRIKLWEAEEANIQFMLDNGLRAKGEHIVDSSGQEYRIENIGNDGIYLFALNRRNKRAYITVDRYGKYTGWTGMVQI